MTRNRNVTIKINEETKQALLRLAGELQAKDGESMTIDDAIRFLFDNQRPDLLKKKVKSTEKKEGDGGKKGQ